MAGERQHYRKQLGRRCNQHIGYFADLKSRRARWDDADQISFSTNTPYDNNGNGWYILYLQATQDALLNPNGASTGSFYAFAVRAYAMPNGDCNSQVRLYKTVNGSVTQISTRTLACQFQYIAIASPDGSVRLAIPNTNPAPGTPPYTVPMAWTDNGTRLYGTGGVGLVGPSDGTGAHTNKAELYAVDRAAPSTIASSDIKTYLMPTEVDLQFAGSALELRAIEIFFHNFLRPHVVTHPPFRHHRRPALLVQSSTMPLLPT